MFSSMKYINLEFSFVCKSSIQLNKYKGSALRGGFGTVFRDITCIDKNLDCKECETKEKCSFAYVFKSIAPKSRLRSLKIINYDSKLKNYNLEI